MYAGIKQLREWMVGGGSQVFHSLIGSSQISKEGRREWDELTSNLIQIQMSTCRNIYGYT